MPDTAPSTSSVGRHHGLRCALLWTRLATSTAPRRPFRVAGRGLASQSSSTSLGVNRMADIPRVGAAAARGATRQGRHRGTPLSPHAQPPARRWRRPLSVANPLRPRGISRRGKGHRGVESLDRRFAQGSETGRRQGSSRQGRSRPPPIPEPQDGSKPAGGGWTCHTRAPRRNES
jgi:hypothetical protein